MASSVRRVLLGFALVWVSAPAWAGAPVFVLPPGEAESTWDGPLSLAGFVRGEGAGGGAVVKVVVAGASWRLEVRDGAGGVRSVTVAAPRDAREREELVWLAASLVRPARSPSTVLAGVPPMTPAELPPITAPVAPPVKPVGTAPVKPVGTVPVRPAAVATTKPTGSPAVDPALDPGGAPAAGTPAAGTSGSPSVDPSALALLPGGSAGGPTGPEGALVVPPPAPGAPVPAETAAPGSSAGPAAPAPVAASPTAVAATAPAVAAAPGAPVEPSPGTATTDTAPPTGEAPVEPAALASVPPPPGPEGAPAATLLVPVAASTLEPPRGPRVGVDAYGLAELRSGTSAIPGVSGGLRLGVSPRWSLTAWGAGGANVPVEAVGAERHLSLGYVGLGAAWSSSAAPHTTGLELGGGGGLALWGLVTEGEGSQTRLGPSAWLRPALRVHLAGPVDLRLAVPFGLDAGRVEVLQDAAPVTSLGRAWVRPGLGLGWSS